MTNAIMIPGGLDLAEIATPRAAAEMVCYLGIVTLPKNGVPAREYRIDDSTGEIVWIEPDRQYIARVWPGLSDKTKGYAVAAGLQVAATYRDALSDGIQLVVYRARAHGWWITTDSNGGNNKAFRQWVKNVITAEEGSATEASQLASTILNLEFLAANGYEGLPVDEDGDPNLEAIFEDRKLYNRWRRVASGLRNLIEAEMEKPDPDNQERIQQIVDDVNNPDKSPDDLDQSGRQRPTLPPASIEMEGKDEMGRNIFKGVATDAQLTLLQYRTKDAAQWVLKGEVYGVTHHTLFEYRTESNDPQVYRRAWSERHGWSAFHQVEKIPEGGFPEGPFFEDPDWGLTYTRQWEEGQIVEWVIRDVRELSVGRLPLYWNDGWVPRESARVYQMEERDKAKLPTSGQWEEA